MGVTWQCPACRALVVVASAHVDARRGAGLSCAACGGTTWLPNADEGEVIDADATVAPPPAARPPPPPALSTAALSRSTDARPRPADPAQAALDIRARVADALAALPPATPTQEPLQKAFDALLGRWSVDEEHKAFLSRASVLGELAFAGQRYRAVLQALPGDERAKKAQGEVLTLAMAQLGAGKDGAVEPAGRGRAKLVVAALFVAGGLVFLGFMVQKMRELGGPPPEVPVAPSSSG